MSRRGWYRDHPAAPWQDCDQWRHWTACELCVQHQQQCGVPGHGAGGGAAEQVQYSAVQCCVPSHGAGGGAAEQVPTSSNLSENNHHAMFGNACHHKCLLPHSYLSCRKLPWKLYIPVILQGLCRTDTAQISWHQNEDHRSGWEWHYNSYGESNWFELI